MVRLKDPSFLRRNEISSFPKGSRRGLKHLHPVNISHTEKGLHFCRSPGMDKSKIGSRTIEAKMRDCVRWISSYRQQLQVRERICAHE